MANQEDDQGQGNREDVTDQCISRRSCRENSTGQHSPTSYSLSKRRGSQTKKHNEVGNVMIAGDIEQANTVLSVSAKFREDFCGV